MDEFKIFVFGITSVAIMLLVFFGGKSLISGEGDRTKALLMVIAGIVTALNLVLWFTFPDVN